MPVLQTTMPWKIRITVTEMRSQLRAVDQVKLWLLKFNQDIYNRTFKQNKMSTVS